VEADGLFSMAETAETIDRLIINGGVARPGDHVGELKVRSLVMNGGVIETGGTGTQGSLVRLRNVTDVRLEATSTATQTPIIRGTGRLVLDGSPDVIVNKGPQPIDLKIDVGIIATTGQGLTKSGAGVAQFTFNNQYPGPTNVAGGTLLIDGSQPASVMNLLGGTLGGTGLVGAIVGGGSGRIAPGRSPGTLSSGSVTLDPGVTFAAELNGTTAGTTHDRLHVTGIVALGNTTLSLAVAAGATLPATSSSP
jgi:autotransporter-associated beta strand protein